MPVSQTVAIRVSPKQLEILERWIETHTDPEGGVATLSDALRAAVEALGQMEARRTKDRERSKRWRAQETAMREIIRRNGHGEPAAIEG